MFNRIFLPLLAGALISGCATQQPVDTQSAETGAQLEAVRQQQASLSFGQQKLESRLAALESAQAVISNCLVRDNEGWGLFVDGVTHGTIIRSNIIEDSGSGRQKTAVRIGKKAGAVQLESNTVKASIELQDERPRLP